MKSRLGKGIFAFSTISLLSVTALANAQTPSWTIRDSQILPYLLDNPHDGSLVRVHCVSKEQHKLDRKRQIIRDRLLRQHVGDRNDTVTVEIEGSCRHVKIRVQDESDFADAPVYNPYLGNNQPNYDDSSWLTREGSGWYWLRHRR